MDVQYNPKTMPLRKKSPGSLAGGLFYNCGRSYCYGLLLTAFLIGTSMYNINRGMTRSLSKPMIRKSTDYLTHLADDMADQPPKMNNSEHRFEEPNNTNNISETVRVDILENDTNLEVEVGVEENAVDFGLEEPNNKNVPEIVRVDISERDASLEVEVEDNAVDYVEVDKAQTMSDKKPRLFLHVGPQKTGSSTLQSTLEKLSDLTDRLKDDNLYYRHIMPEAEDFDCELGQWGGYHNCKASDKLKDLIRKARDEGNNLLLTDENLGKDFSTGLRDAIDDNDWDVTVVVMYRRIHEWLISWYNQINKTTNKDPKGNVLYNEEGIPYRTEHTTWPDEGGEHIPSFSSWYEEYTRYWKPAELVNNHQRKKTHL